MVELEEGHVALAAVDAHRVGKDAVHEVQVPPYRRRETPLWIVDVAGQPGPAGALRGHAPVAVGAADLALRDLLHDAGPRRTASDQRADQLALLADMVEVEHALVALAAVHARVLREVARHRRASERRPFAS